MSNVTPLPSASTQILAKARAEVEAELSARAVEAFKAQLRTVAADKAVLAGAERKLADLQQQIDDGTF